MKNKRNRTWNRRQFLKTSLAGSAAALIFPSIVPASVLGKNAPSNKIHIGHIGCGRIGVFSDVTEVMKYDVARVIAVCDIDRKRLEGGKKYVEDGYAGQAGKPGYLAVKAYEDYHDLLANKEIDAVMISTPDHWHAQPAIEAALAGKHIYLQKPASLTIEEGRLMSDVVRRRGVVFQIGSQQRSVYPWPQFKRACELVRNGRIGQLKHVRIELPGDAPGGNRTEMPVPQNLDYDKWLGATPEAYYTLDRVHPQDTIFARPGWLRCEQFGAGMITGWGAHHIDTAHWGMNTELTGPVEIEGNAEFFRNGLWDVHGAFEVTAKYANGVIMHISGKRAGAALNGGIRFEGTNGWIFVTRSNEAVTPSDPVSGGKLAQAFQASDPKILTSEIGPGEVHLYESRQQHGNWLDCIQNGKPTVAPVEVAHRSCSACLIAHTAMKLQRKLYWDPEKERFRNDDEANATLSRPQRYPYGTRNVKGILPK